VNFRETNERILEKECAVDPQVVDTRQLSADRCNVHFDDVVVDVDVAKLLLLLMML